MQQQQQRHRRLCVYSDTINHVKHIAEDLYLDIYTEMEACVGDGVQVCHRCLYMNEKDACIEMDRMNTRNIF